MAEHGNPVPSLKFSPPGWKTRWEQRGDLLTLRWEMQDSNECSDSVNIGTQVHLSEVDGDIAKAAWFCVKHAVLHEGAEWLWVNGERPYHPHLAKWWWESYRAGPSIGIEDQVL
jgi:hypothetical protein